MFAFISFLLKLIFASFFGGIIFYKTINENKMIFIQSILICIFSTALLDLAQQFPQESIGYISGFCIASILVLLIFLLNEFNTEDQISLFFVALIGIITGSGFVLQAIVLTGVVYFIKENNKTILKYINDNNESHEKM